MNPALAVPLALILAFFLGYWLGRRSLKLYKDQLYRRLYQGKGFKR